MYSVPPVSPEYLQLGGTRLSVCALFHVSDRICFDAVGRVTGRVSGQRKTGCWFVGGDDLTGALHDQLSLPLPTSFASINNS